MTAHDASAWAPACERQRVAAESAQFSQLKSTHIFDYATDAQWVWNCNVIPHTMNVAKQLNETVLDMRALVTHPVINGDK